jgi:urease accessory protein
MDDDEAFLLLLLSDGNLPTGSFVASSGLEAYVKHGFSSLPYLSGTSTSMGHATALPLPLQSGATINFIRDGVQTYARSSLPFLSAVYQACDTLARSSNPLEYLPAIFRQIRELDDLYEAATMNHVARRASTSQGVALLTLLLKGLARPAWAISIDGEEAAHAKQIEELAGMFKSEIRRGSTPGHLPLCWAMLTSALGLSCGKEMHI